MAKKKWYNVEITKEEFSILRFYLKAKGYIYEPSECYNFVHVEVYMFENETQELNAFIDAIEELENTTKFETADVLREVWGVK